METLLTFTVSTALGCWIFMILRTTAFQKMTNLSVLMPPDVDPAQAHWMVKNMRTRTTKGGQTEESAVAKPVDVPREIT